MSRVAAREAEQQLDPAIATSLAEAAAQSSSSSPFSARRHVRSLHLPRPLQKAALAFFLGVTIATAGSGCAIPSSPIRPTPTEQPSGTGTSSPDATPIATPSPNPTASITKEIAQYESEFNSGTTQVTINKNSFPGANVVLMERQGAGVTYSYRTSPNGPWKQVTIQYDGSVFDWNNRSTPGLTVVSQDGSNIVDKMATVYGGNTQQINNGRPVSISNLNATLIEIQGTVSYKDGKQIITPLPGQQGQFAMGIMFSASNLTPAPANLG